MMRLTLRTLLAYLDDTLGASQAKEIGQKLKESSLASSLVSRIREVMRRRRLTAPTLSGPGVGIDPNTVAEYLDSTLPPDGVADVEKICLESDIHLAEVAACHQILALALGEPVDVPIQTRERMYGLGPSATKFDVEAAKESLVLTGELPPSAVEDVLAQAASAKPVVSVVAPAKPEIPEYLRKKSNAKRVFSYAAVATVLVIWLVMVVKNSPFSGNLQPDGSDKGNNRVVAQNERKEVGDNEAESNDNQMEPTEDTSPVDDENVEPSTEVATVPKSNDQNNKKSQPNVSDQGNTTVAKSNKKSRPAKENGTKEPVAPPPEAVAPPVVPPMAKYVSKEGIALTYSHRDERWFVLPRGEVILPGANLAVPEPFQCRLEINEGKGTVTILGHSLAGMIPPLDDGKFGIEVQRGQCVVRALPSDDGAPRSLKFRVGIAREIWQVELQGGAVCGIIVKPIEPTQLDLQSSRPLYEGAFYINDGVAAITNPSGQTLELQGPDWLEFPQIPDEEGNPSKKRPLEYIPTWMGTVTLNSVAQSQATVFEKKFVRSEAVELSLPEIADDSHPYVSRFATECLGLIEAYIPLVGILRSHHVEARKIAISELRLWLLRHPDNRDLLEAELVLRYPPKTAQAINRLLWGYSDDDAHDKEKSLELVELMGDSELAVRELAIYQVYRLTGKTREYQADASPGKLRSSLKSWQEHIKRDGGLLPTPKPTPNPQ